MKMKTLFVILIASTLMLSACGPVDSQPSVESLAKAPDFTIETLDGSEVSLFGNLAGKRPFWFSGRHGVRIV